MWEPGGLKRWENISLDVVWVFISVLLIETLCSFSFPLSYIMLHISLSLPISYLLYLDDCHNILWTPFCVVRFYINSWFRSCPLIFLHWLSLSCSFMSCCVCVLSWSHRCCYGALWWCALCVSRHFVLGFWEANSCATTALWRDTTSSHIDHLKGDFRRM